MLRAGSPANGVLHGVERGEPGVQPVHLRLRQTGHRLEHQHPRPAAGEVIGPIRTHPRNPTLRPQTHRSQCVCMAVEPTSPPSYLAWTVTCAISVWKYMFDSMCAGCCSRHCFSYCQTAAPACR